MMATMTALCWDIARDEQMDVGWEIRWVAETAAC
jgi:hypothetical protein